MSNLCCPHRRGVDPTKPLTYAPECDRCRDLLAEGKRTGLEPHPSTVYLRGGSMRQRYSKERFAQVVEYVKDKQKKSAADDYRRFERG